MSRINKINYEQYALDYLEGNLSGELLIEMQAFLLKHPEIASEFGALDLPYLTPETAVVYTDKESLLQTTSTGTVKKDRRFLLVLGMLLLFGIVGTLYIQMPSKKEIVNSTIDTIEKEEVAEPIIADEVVIEEEKNLIEATPNTAIQTIAKPEKPTIYQSTPQQISPSEKNRSKTEIKDVPVSNDNDKQEENTQPKDPAPIFAGTQPSTQEVKQNSSPEEAAGIIVREKIIEIEAIESSKPSLIAISNTPLPKIPEGELSVDWTGLEDEIEDKSSRLAQMGLVPEKSDRKITMRKIRNALVPETFASNK